MNRRLYSGIFKDPLDTKYKTFTNRLNSSLCNKPIALFTNKCNDGNVNKLSDAQAELCLCSSQKLQYTL